MIKLIIAELERIFQKKSTKVLFLVAFSFPILTFLFYQLRWHFYTDIVNGIKFPLNSFNYSVYNLMEYNFLLVFILLPLLLTESLSSEIDSGAFRFVLIRPIKKWKLLVAKWISLSFVYALLLLCTFATKLIIGFGFLPKVQYTKYYNLKDSFGFLDSMVYNIKYYMLIFVLHIILLWIVTFISIIIKKPILSYIGSIGIIVGCAYLYEPVSRVFMQTTDYAYSILGNDYNIARLFYLVPVMIVLSMLSLWRWNREIGYRA